MTLPKEYPVLVTGGSGYIASWICKYLMEEGYHVRATFRNSRDIAKYEHLQRIDDVAPGTLEIWEANLLEPGSFDDVVEGCHTVFHVASPFILFDRKDAYNKLVKPAVEGTKTVLEAVSRASSVKRVVLTSSIQAMFGDTIEIHDQPNGVFNQDSWNTTSNLKHQPYPYSKRLAEETAWEIAKDQSWEMVVMNPGFVLGPSLTARKDGASVDLMLQFANGKLKSGVPKVFMGIVDVRDVARAHIKAAQTAKAKGRYILVGHETSLLDISKSLGEEFNHLPLPKDYLPNWVLRLFGLFIGMTPQYIKRNLEHKPRFDIQPSIQDLSMSYRPLEETVQDMMWQLDKDGLVKKRRK